MTRPARSRVRLAAAVMLLPLGAMAACGSESDAPEREVVDVGGFKAEPKTVSRPWGVVPLAPEMEKAETPSEADATFIRDMVPHHRQALRLSKQALSHEGLDEQVATVAGLIAGDQRNEIAIMQSWLDAWGDDLPPEDPDHDHTTMPGMLPEAEIRALGAMDEAAAAVAFLQLMVRHHEGAVQMSQDYLVDGVNSYVLSNARHVIREQAQEVSYMENLIDELCAKSRVDSCPRR